MLQVLLRLVPQVSIGSVNRSGNNYTVPITLTRAGLTSDHGATVVINVSDSAGNAAIAKTVALVEVTLIIKDLFLVQQVSRRSHSFFMEQTH